MSDSGESQRNQSVRSARVLLASNRGPVSFRLAAGGGELTASRGGGGLVSGLSSIEADPGEAVWVCAALSAGDREAARRSPGGRLDRSGLLDQDGGAAVRMLDIDPETFHAAYNGVANSTLWFVQHMLYATPTSPAFGPEFAAQWRAFEAYNRAFAEALAEEAAEGARVLIQDYHLCLAPKFLRQLRPDLRIGHFSHTPWAPPDYFRILPDAVAAEILEGMLGADRTCFLTRRWADAFADCCQAVLGRRPAPGQLGVHSLGVDAPALIERSAQPDVARREQELRAAVGEGRQVLVRVDRTELSKNIVRGLEAYAQLLRTHPEWRGKIVHIAFAYPSRTDLAEYREYTASVQRLAKEIEVEFASPEHPGWLPLMVHVEDDFARSLAAYRMADVAVVNPIRDGMNLVAKEIPIIAQAAGRSTALVLSREAGAYAELAADAFTVNPYDVTATAEAMHAALSQNAADRAARCARLAEAGGALPPQKWFSQQLEALEEL
ncbi:trehalose-6-phosphate synthase [Actinospica sp. MGRD01-02]|uniref:Trehalose-6-phosphate synthase n=1 Tax=Actinospica acidithermotolerans TaxID=2828514 RepID=A0A941IJM6_9ACTN|nr:trehalose-6-phosphate synthase [Actinospica acidithermotolerans]MBR7829634.1 trehalose-6-phosphate synthase [Actinospica acidithermotolerans]